MSQIYQNTKSNNNTKIQTTKFPHNSLLQEGVIVKAKKDCSIDCHYGFYTVHGFYEADVVDGRSYNEISFKKDEQLVIIRKPYGGYVIETKNFKHIHESDRHYTSSANVSILEVQKENGETIFVSQKDITKNFKI